MEAVSAKYFLAPKYYVTRYNKADKHLSYTTDREHRRK